jgi:hypothetical protein
VSVRPTIFRGMRFAVHCVDDIAPSLKGALE